MTDLSPATIAALDQARAAVAEITDTSEWKVIEAFAPKIATRIVLADLVTVFTAYAVNDQEPATVLAHFEAWLRYLEGRT